MDYEKKYMNALEWAKQVMNGKTGFVLSEVKEIFPELKESEDEGIGEEIITYLSTVDDKELIPYERWIAWVEKQDEQKNLIAEINRRIEQYRVEKEEAQSLAENMSLGGRIAALEEILAFQKQGEQKIDPDTLIQQRVDALADILAEQEPTEDSCKSSDDIIIEEKDRTEYKKGFECGKQRVLKYPEDFGLCRSHAWSEEDERLIKFLVAHFSICYANRKFTFDINTDLWTDEIIERIRNLRPQKQWKPSDEQMNAIKDAIDYLGGNTKIVRKYLISLYEDLKKL